MKKTLRSVLVWLLFGSPAYAIPISLPQVVPGTPFGGGSGGASGPPGTGCIPTGSAGDVLWDNGLGGCSVASAFHYDAGAEVLKAGGLITTSLTGLLQGNASSAVTALSASAASKLLGRGSAAGAGAYEEIAVGTGLTMTGTTLSATAGSGTGDVVGPGIATDGGLAQYDGTTGKLLKNTGGPFMSGANLFVPDVLYIGGSTVGAAGTWEFFANALCAEGPSADANEFCWDVGTFGADVTLALSATASSYTQTLTTGQQFQFASPVATTTSATRAALRIGSLAGDPSTPANGDIWYNSSTGKFRKREGGTTTDLDSGGIGSGDVVGPGIATDNTVALFDGTTGKLLKDGATFNLPFANLVQASTISKLIGRGSAAGAGDFQEITLGSGLSMSGTTLSSTGGGDVTGPATATDNALPRFDGITGKVLQGSLTVLDDSENLSGLASVASTFYAPGSGTSASAGVYRLANNTEICWRNAANDGNLCMGYDGSDVFNLDGSGGVTVFTFTEGSAPAAPAAGSTALYVPTGGVPSGKDSGGLVANMVKADAGAANNFLTAISVGGVISKAQPTVANLSSSTSASLRTVLSDEVGTGAAMFGLISTMADDLTCAGGQFVRRNAGDTAFECATVAGTGDVVGPGIATDNGLAQYNGTTGKLLEDGPASSTVGSVLRTTGAGTYAFGQVDLADTDAVTGDLPLANVAAASGASKLLGRGSASGAGDFQEVTLGSGLTMSGTVLSSSSGAFNPLDEDVIWYREEFGFGIANTTGANATNGWTQTNSSGGSCTVAVVNPGTYNNTGQYSIATGNVQEGGCALRSSLDMFGPLGNTGGWDSVFIFSINSTTQARHRVGYAGDQATQPADWFGVRYDTDAAFADTNFMICARVASGTETCADTGIAADTSFHKVRIRSVSAATVLVTFDAVAEKSIASGGDANITPTTTELAAQFQAGTDTTSAKSIIADFWAYTATVTR